MDLQTLKDINELLQAYFAPGENSPYITTKEIDENDERIRKVQNMVEKTISEYQHNPRDFVYVRCSNCKKETGYWSRNLWICDNCYPDYT
jgi:hypothetical protein